MGFDDELGMAALMSAWQASELSELEMLLSASRKAPEATAAPGGLQEAVQEWCVAWLDEAQRAEFIGGDFVRGVEALLRRLSKACGEDLEPSESVAWADGFPDAVVVRVLTEAMRFARNLALDSRAQAALAPLVQPAALAFLRLDKLHGGGTFEEWQQLVVTASHAVAQALANLCTQNEENQAALWTEPTLISLVSAFCFALRLSDLKLLASLTHLAYILALGHEQRAEQLACHAQLPVLLLQSAAVALEQLNRAEAEGASSAKVGSAGGAGADQAAALAADDAQAQAAAQLHASCVWVVGHLVNAGHGAALLAASDRAGDGKLGPILFSLWLGHRLEEEDEMSKAEAQARLAPEPDLDQGQTRDDDKVEASFEALGAAFLHATAPVDSISEDGRDAVLSSVLVRLVGSYAIDQRIYKAQPDKVDVLHRLLDLLEQATAESSKVAYGFRGDVLRAITNLTFRHRRHQDAVREKPGALFTVLNQCGVDENSPFLREWGIMAIRNLTENNIDNQDMIASLRVQGTVKSSLIEKAGLTVEMTEDGKAKLRRL